jgi:hypothetical protein
MKTRISTRLRNPLKSTIDNRRPHAVTAAAEAELSAFYHAVRIHHGTAAATAATEHWLRAFAAAPIDRDNSQASFRRVTIAAASQLSADIAQQASRSPLGCKLCSA